MTLPTITVNQPPTVGTVMDELVTLLPGYVDPISGSPTPLSFSFGDLPPPTRDGTLDFIKFGQQGNEYELSAANISAATKAVANGPNGEELAVAWQYYVFNKDPTGRDERIEVSGRSRYRESVMVRNNSRIISRLICTYLNPNNGTAKTDVKQNQTV